MRKILLTFTLFLLLFSCLDAQELVSSSGNSFINAKGTIHYSVGELMVETYNNGSNYLTQGFHQPKLTVTSISEMNNDKINVVVFPNPTSDELKLIINLDKLENIRFELYDLNGMKIIQDDIRNTETTLELNNLKSSIYILRIFKDNKKISTYKIIKN
jgi:hypothetical protein